MYHFLREVFANILAHIFTIGVLAIGAWILAHKTLFGVLVRYRHQLRNQLKMMPFIYADLQGDVLNDYVDLEIHGLDGTSHIDKTAARLLLRDRERFQRNRRVIFLGDAGIGKTTYQRFAILSLLNRSSLFSAPIDVVYSARSSIPVYVPLKLVDNSEPFPVLRFLLDKHALFNTRVGLYRLKRYVAQGRLFLFLDGYDEISADGGANHLKDELTELFGTSTKWRAETLHSKYQSLLSLARSVRSCRIWLSSRREFFDHNAIPIDMMQGQGPESVAAVELGGVGPNRLRLTKNIFDKYRRREAFYKEILNEEYFISELDRSLDDDVRAISYNPLFLTVMCYVYVSEVAKHKQHDVEWLKHGFEDLILECVRLLLVDLDKTKARDLPAAHREGLLRRRNEYATEKEAFLMYFAAEMLFDGTGAFTLELLRKSIYTFFESETWPTKSEILNQMRDGRSRRPDFALQLVYSGIFTTVFLDGKDYYYDFPHRRFRETLALRYVRTAPRYCRALLQADRVHFGEFLRLLQSSDLVRQRDFQLSALQHILHLATRSGQRDRDVTASRNLFRLAPPGMDFAPEVRAWIHQMVQEPTPRFEVAFEVLQACKGDQDLPTTLVDVLERSIITNARERFALSMRCLELAWPSVASEALLRLGQRMMDSHSTRVSAIQAMLKLGTGLIPMCIQRCESDQEFAGEFLYALMAAMSKAWIEPTKCTEVCASLSRRLQCQFLGFVARFAPDRFGAVCQGIGEKVKMEWLHFLVTLPPNELEDLGNGEVPIYIRSDRTRLTLTRKVSDIKKIYVRALVVEKVWNAHARPLPAFEQTMKAVSIVPTRFVAVLESVIAELEGAPGVRIDWWPDTVQRVRQEVDKWLKTLTPQSHEERLATQTEIQASAFADWLVQETERDMAVSPQRLKELAPATIAWKYEPHDVPDFFV